MPESFCVFILTHGRPDNVITLRTLQRDGYTGPWFLVVDNEDPTRTEYITRYGADRVLVFDKAAISQTFDTADLSSDRRTVVFARNACFQIARDLGYAYFLQLDDDYTKFDLRVEDNGHLRARHCRDLDRLFAVGFAFLQTTQVATVAFAQAGDFIGGVGSSPWQKKFLRKAMNTFFCRAADDWRFVGRVNEDVNTYTTLSHRGMLLVSTVYAAIVPRLTQINPGGMTDAYRDGGTYVKSFYTVMMCPSAVRIASMGRFERRIHHKINWNACAPKILDQRYCKAVA